MKSFHNIEKSGFRRGEYVGWEKSTGNNWRIRKTGFGGWEAMPGNTAQRNYTKSSLRAATLEAMSKQLENM